MNNQILIDPKVCHVKPVVRGTRVPVSLIVGSLAGGLEFEEVEREYGVTRDQIRTALKFAGKLVEEEQKLKQCSLGALKSVLTFDAYLPHAWHRFRPA